MAGTRRTTAVLTGEPYNPGCPFMGSCWGNMGCAENSCPSTLGDMFARTAELEHELGLIPHNDPDIEANCRRC